MGSKAGKKERKAADFYPTPQPLVRLGINLSLDRYVMTHGLQSRKDVPVRELNFLDPGCGPDGRFALTASAMMFGRSIGVDITKASDKLDQSELKKRNVLLYHESDYLTEWSADENVYYDFIVGNPPFSIAEQFIRRSFDFLSRDGVLCFILRVGFWESKNRAEFYSNPRNKPAETLILQQRPSFYSDTGIGPTDGTAYAFFVWDGETVHNALRGAGIRPIVDCLSWR